MTKKNGRYKLRKTPYSKPTITSREADKRDYKRFNSKPNSKKKTMEMMVGRELAIEESDDSRIFERYYR